MYVVAVVTECPTAASVRLRGRDAEQRALALALGDARSGRGARLLVSGGPGSGKSALLDHACATAGDFTLLTADGVAAETGLAHAGLQRLLRPVTHHLADLDPQQAAVLRCALEPGHGGPADRFALGAAVLALLARAGRAAPVLCRVDDAHLLDAPSLHALAFAARRVDGEAVAVLLSARDGSADPVAPGVPVLRLPPLRDRALADLLADHGPPGLTPDVRAALVRAAHGNPRAALGFAAALDPDQAAGRAALPEPLLLHEELRRAHAPRVRALPPVTRHLVLLAAADPEAGADTLVEAAGAGTVDAFAPAEDAGIVRLDGGRIVFPDPLLRAAVYQDAPAARRRAAHRVLAGLVDPGREPARHARHRAAAAHGPDRRLAAELAAAGDAARGADGPAAASAVFERAADLTPDGPMRGCRLITAATDAWQAGHPQRASALLDRVRPDTGRLAGLVELLRGNIGARDGNAIDATETLLTAASRLVPHDREYAVRALLRAADAASIAGDATRHAVAARRLAPLARPDDPPALRLGFDFVEGCRASFAADYATAVPLLRRCMELGEQVDEPAELVWASIAGLRMGDGPRVHAMAARAVLLARRRGTAYLLPPALLFLVFAEFWSGRFPAAAGNCLEGVRRAQETGQPNWAVHHLAGLALVAAIRGDADDCRARARMVAEQATEESLGLATALSTWALAVLNLAQGDAAEAFYRLRALAHAGPGYGHPTMRLLTAPHFVEAAVRTGETAWAERALAGYERWAAATDSPAALALAARCRGLLAGAGRAEEHFEEALRLHRLGGDDDVERARTQLLFGTVLRRGRLPGRAREHLRDAQETFERFGARLWVRQARAELRAIGDPERSPGAPEPGAGPVELTAQQRQIALLVAEGATNREVAAHMFISPRTVEHHLRGIFRKLNIRSRIDLARLFP